MTEKYWKTYRNSLIGTPVVMGLYMAEKFGRLGYELGFHDFGMNCEPHSLESMISSAVFGGAIGVGSGLMLGALLVGPVACIGKKIYDSVTEKYK